MKGPQRLLLFLIATGHAAALAQPAIPAAPQVAGDAIAARGDTLGGLLLRTMEGQRVIAVGEGGRRPAPAARNAVLKEKTTLDRLQVLTESVSAPGREMIPFGVRETWVVAPEWREEVNTDLGSLSPWEAMDRGQLFKMVLLLLTDGQLKRLSTEAGLRVADLEPSLRGAVRNALRPPLTGVRRSTGASGANGAVTPDEEVISGLGQGAVPSGLRLRGGLWIPSLAVGASTETPGLVALAQGPPSTPMLQETGDVTTAPTIDTGAVNVQAAALVPNRYKPSDLDGRTLTAACGLQGVYSLEDVLRQLSTETALKLSAASGYRKMPVFIGSREIPAGDVVDGLRLATCGAWRRLGSRYILAWDRRGLGAVQQLLAESVADLQSDVLTLTGKADLSARWLDIARDLPFDQSAPLALTDDQRRRLLDAPYDPSRGEEGAARLRFPDMNAAQREYITSLVGRATVMSSAHPGAPHVPPHPLSESDLDSVSIVFNPRVRLEILLPDAGWVRVPDNWSYSGLNPYALDQIRRRTETSSHAPSPERPEQKPYAVPAETRALIVPLLTPSRLAEIAPEMQRRGFRTLFYPLVYGGYASFPNSTFPLSPTLRAKDGWESVVTTMKAHGIRVVGYVECLTWQSATDKVHWLNKHPSWLDVDITGRPWLAWMAAHGAKGDFPLTAAAPGNRVRATEPAVEAKLRAMLQEFSHRPDAGDIALADWSSTRRVDYYGQTLPRLGYSVADRLTALTRDGDDPVDFADPSIPFTPREPGAVVRRPARTGAPEDPGAALATRLIADVKKPDAGRIVWLLDTTPGPALESLRKAVPTADRVVAAPTPGFRDPDVQVSTEPESDPARRGASGDGRPGYLRALERLAASDTGARRLGTAIFDFRTTPDDILPFLRRIEVPEQESRGDRNDRR